MADRPFTRRDAPCQPAPCGGERQDERASHTRIRAHDTLGRPYAHTRCVSHISSTLQHKCTFVQTEHTSVLSHFSTLPAPRSRCAPPFASTARLTQAALLSDLELPAGSPNGNIFAACNAHNVISPLAQLVACAGNTTTLGRRKIIHRRTRHRRNHQLHRRNRERGAEAAAVACECSAVLAEWNPIQATRPVRMPAKRGCRLTPMPAPCGCSP